MIISMIVAMDRQGAIGLGDQLPWVAKHGNNPVPADMQRFRDLTRGKPVVMGRKTFESIGRPLPQRPNIVITRNRGYKADGIIIAHSLLNSLEQAGAYRGVEEAMIIGGAEIYKLAMPIAQRIYLTVIGAEFDGDIFFPQIPADWKVIPQETIPIDEQNLYPMDFFLYEKI